MLQCTILQDGGSILCSPKVCFHLFDEYTIMIYGQEFPAFSPGFRGAVFAVSNDEPPRDGETDQERVAQEERNTDRRA
jgi:hypothetical protein